MDKEQFFDPTHLEKLVGSRESELTSCYKHGEFVQ